MIQGSHASWKVLENPGFLGKIFRTWKVLKNGFGLGKTWKFWCKVLESSGFFEAMLWEADTMMQVQMPEFVIIRSDFICIYEKPLATGTPPWTP